MGVLNDALFYAETNKTPTITDIPKIQSPPLYRLLSPMR